MRRNIRLTALPDRPSARLSRARAPEFAITLRAPIVAEGKVKAYQSIASVSSEVSANNPLARLPKKPGSDHGRG